MQNFQGLIKNRVDIPRETKKKSCKISSGLDFLALEFLRDVTYIIIPISRGGALSSLEFREVRRTTTKILGLFPKKYVLKPPWFFSGIAQSKAIDLNWSYEALAQREALTLCQDRAFASFSCVLLLASVLGRFIHLYYDTGSLGRGAPLYGK